MRIGGAVVKPYQGPEEWLALVRDLSYGAVFAPVEANASQAEKKAYLECAKDNNLVIGEVGIWKNTLSKNEAERQAALEYSRQQLALADELGANCCVNIAGARGEVWDGCYAENYGADAYALLVDTVRSLIDSVRPTRTFYTLEPMPWMHPDSPDDYLRLLRDVDRKQFAVHLDFANMINSVEKYLHSTAFITECFQKLGPHIKSIHAKDVCLEEGLPCRICETAPGKGTVNFVNVVRLTESLGEDTTLYVEHLDTYDEYQSAAARIRLAAEQAGVMVKSVTKDVE